MTNMKMSILVSMAALVSAQAQDDLPKKLNFDRYKGILDHSPFAVASAVVAPAATPNFAKDLFVANAAKAPDCDMVTIASSSDKEFKKYLTTCGGPVDGYSIGSIEWSDKVGETKVTISKDGQYATLTFNQAEISKPLPNKPGPGLAPQPMPQPGQPGMPRPPVQNLPVAAPTPHVRGTIQRNPQPQQPAQIRTPPPATVEE
jgi:hypothetical protein